MNTYDNLLAAVVRYFREHGETQETVDKLETLLPGAWSGNLISDALESLDMERGEG